MAVTKLTSLRPTNQATWLEDIPHFPLSNMLRQKNGTLTIDFEKNK